MKASRQSSVTGSVPTLFLVLAAGLPSCMPQAAHVNRDRAPDLRPKIKVYIDEEYGSGEHIQFLVDSSGILLEPIGSGLPVPHRDLVAVMRREAELLRRPVVTIRLWTYGREQERAMSLDALAKTIADLRGAAGEGLPRGTKAVVKVTLLSLRERLDAQGCPGQAAPESEGHTQSMCHP